VEEVEGDVGERRVTGGVGRGALGQEEAVVARGEGGVEGQGGDVGVGVEDRQQRA